MQFSTMTDALLEVALIELEAGGSLDPVIVLGVQGGSDRLSAYAHLRRLPDADGRAFPFDLAPARMAFLRDGVGLFGLCYAVWDRPHGHLTASPPRLLTRQSGVVTVVGDRTRSKAVYRPFLWDGENFAGFGLSRPADASPMEGLLDPPGEEMGQVIRLDTRR